MIFNILIIESEKKCRVIDIQYQVEYIYNQKYTPHVGGGKGDNYE